MSLDNGDGRFTSVTHTAEFGDLWRILRYRWVWVLGTTAVCVVVALLYALVASAQFTATAEVLIDPRDRQILAKDVTPDTLAADGGLIQVESQSRVIASDTVLLRAVDTLKLDSDPEFGGHDSSIVSNLVEGLQNLLGLKPGSPSDARDKALRQLRRHLTVKRADKVFVIDVSVYAITAEKAARISDAVAEAYIADQVEARSTASRRASDALSDRLASLRDDVRSAELRVESYKKEHDLVGTDKELVSDLQLEDSNRKLADAQARTADLHTRVEQLDALRKSGGDLGSVPEAAQSAVITQLRSSAQDLVRRESDLRTRLGARHPDLIALSEQVKEVKRQIGTELARVARSARSDYERALAYQQSLTTNLDTSKRKTFASGQASVELHELNRELDARRSLYQAFLARSAETGAQANIDSFNARILSKAIPPDRAGWPPRLLIVLGALAGGLGLGASLAFALDYASPAIVSAEQLHPVVDGPVTLIPAGRPLGKRRGFFRRSNAPAEDAAVALALSRLCGPIGNLRGAPKPYVLLLTSTPRDAGTRTDAVDRVARVAAFHGLSVLQIDADLTKAGGRANGFLNVLNADCPLDSAALTQRGSGVKRLPVGNEGRVLGDLRPVTLRKFIEDAGRYFDFIVFDGGAAEHNLRIAPLTADVDEVVLIATQGETSRRAVEAVADAMQASSGRPLSAAMLFPQLARA